MNKQEINFWGSGWSFPPTFEVGNYQLDITDKEQNIVESIRLILNTNRGERNFDPYFGCDMNQFLFKTMDAALQAEIKHVVESNLLEYEPRIKVENVAVEFADINSGLIEITLYYAILQTNTRHNKVFPFYINEGTNL